MLWKCSPWGPLQCLHQQRLPWASGCHLYTYVSSWQSSPFFFTLSTSILLAIAFASILRGLSDTPLYSSLLVGVMFFLILNRSFLHMFAPHKCKTSFPIWSLELCDFTITPMTTRLKYNQHVLGVFLMPSKPTVYYPVYGYCMAFVPRPKKIQ